MTAVMMILIVIIIMNVRELEQVILHDNGGSVRVDEICFELVWWVADIPSKLTS